MATTAKKQNYAKKLHFLLEKYRKALLVNCDNVGSKQFQDIRRAIRHDSVVLMGKNTLIKRCLNLYLEESDKATKVCECLPNLLCGNIGIIFTDGDLVDVRTEILKFKVGAPARVGAIASYDVTVPAGNTGMDPSVTSFFQALNLPTKINKGTVEIINDVTVIKEGDRVGSSEAALLSKLGIKPFSYGLQPIRVFEDGQIYDPKILDLISTEDHVMGAAMLAVQNIAAVSLALCIPTLAAIPHQLLDCYKNILAIALTTDYSFPKADKIRDLINNPVVFDAAVPIKSCATDVPAPKPETKSDSDEDMCFSLFE